MRIKGSILMFLQVFVYGAISPIISLYLLNDLGFSGSQVGIILSVSGVAAFASPILFLFITDRMMTAKKLLMICHLLASISMMVLSFQDQFKMVLFVYFIYGFVLGPTTPLVTIIILEYLENTKKYFGSIKMWGTIGWISAGWLISFFFLNNKEYFRSSGQFISALRLAGMVSFLIVLYLFTIPESRKKSMEKSKRVGLPKDAIQIMKEPSHILLCIAILLVNASYNYYNFGMAPYLAQNLYPDNYIMPLLSISQIVEVIGFAVVGILVLKKGIPKIMLAGIGFTLLRDVFLLIGSLTPFTMGAIIGEGLSNAFFVAACALYLDSISTDETRAGIQQIYGIIAYGFAAFFGNTAAGIMNNLVTIGGDKTINYFLFWSPQFFASLLSLLLIYFSFKIKRHENKNKEEFE